MSQENVQSIVRGYKALNRGDLDGAVKGISPDCQVIMPPMLPEADSYQGRAGLRQMWAAWRESFDGFCMDIEETIDAGDKVVVMASLRGKGTDSGADVRTPTFPIVWTVRDSQVVRLEAFPTRAAALETLGLQGS
jgi:ketosteroid isomerase-like protein